MWYCGYLVALAELTSSAIGRLLVAHELDVTFQHDGVVVVGQADRDGSALLEVAHPAGGGRAAEGERGVDEHAIDRTEVRPAVVGRGRQPVVR